MQRYNVVSLIREGLRGHTGWEPAWRFPEPKASYDAVIIGGGGHGLATAYYLAKVHGLTNIAVIEKGWIGGGNSGRNTTVIRSNYLNDESAAIYQHALDLWKTLGRELDFNIMMSHRGVLNLAHDEGEARQLRRRVEANRLNGIDAEWLEPDEVKEFCPPISISPIASLSGDRRDAAALRRRQPPRRGRLGLCARRRRDGRRHHPAMRGDEHPHRRTARSPASRRRAARSAPARSAASPPGTPASSPTWSG